MINEPWSVVHDAQAGGQPQWDFKSTIMEILNNITNKDISYDFMQGGWLPTIDPEPCLNIKRKLAKAIKNVY